MAYTDPHILMLAERAFDFIGQTRPGNGNGGLATNTEEPLPRRGASGEAAANSEVFRVRMAYTDPRILILVERASNRITAPGATVHPTTLFTEVWPPTPEQPLPRSSTDRHRPDPLSGDIGAGHPGCGRINPGATRLLRAGLGAGLFDALADVVELGSAV